MRFSRAVFWYGPGADVIGGRPRKSIGIRRTPSVDHHMNDAGDPLVPMNRAT